MVAFRELSQDDVDWLVAAHAVHYAASDGFDASFVALVREILEDFLADHDLARERSWIAYEDGMRLGSIFCVRQSDEVAKLRLFYLGEAARGRGLGREMLTRCMDFARDAGYRRMELWTHASHAAACALYAKLGFEMTGAVTKHSFGVEVEEQMWGIDL
ncbi:N-acetyltransferase family protein [Roseobacteraceae bacterium S113]